MEYDLQGCRCYATDPVARMKVLAKVRGLPC